jgi:hypothetical protein
LEWYSNQLLHHADALLHVAYKIFKDSPVQLQVKLPAIHWWHHTQSHAVCSALLYASRAALNLIEHLKSSLCLFQAELTAGINHTSMREGYLPIMDALARWECDVLISACEQLTSQQPMKASCDPEALISHVHTCASVVDRQVRASCLTPDVTLPLASQTPASACGVAIILLDEIDAPS